MDRALLQQISDIAPTLHGAGTIPAEALTALARHASSRRIAHSAETGCGASTLLLSHLSDHHLAFAVDAGNSLTNVKSSPMLRPGTVEFVDGPTQLTVPRFEFKHTFQLVLIDGPHGWPFPDLEYYYFYPRIDEGGLLAIDDIQIPTVTRMFEILRSDAMWELREVVTNTAFFVRTQAPAICPTGDDWEKQGYNATRRNPRPRGLVARAIARLVR